MNRPNSDLDVLFNPRSVAIIGASNRPESISGQFLQYLTRHKFAGPIYPVNRDTGRSPDIAATKISPGCPIRWTWLSVSYRGNRSPTWSRSARRKAWPV